MIKKGKLLKLFLYIIIFCIFVYYESKLYKQYLIEEKIREGTIAKMTEKIESSFFIRKNGFYLDKKYIKLVEDRKEKEKILEDSNVGGDENIEQDKSM